MSKILVLAALVLAACDTEPQDWQVNDQCLRAKLFAECLAAIPAGPTTVVNNDWNEVVDSCASQAYAASLRVRSQVEPQCRSSR